MVKTNSLNLINSEIEQLKREYFAFLASKELKNTFDNCNDYLSLRYSNTVSKREFGVSTRAQLAEIISGQQPNNFSI